MNETYRPALSRPPAPVLAIEPLTLRDYFAAQILPAIYGGFGGESPRVIVEEAYRFADTMLAERERAVPA